MTDLLQVVPDFPAKQYSHLLPSLEKHLVTTSDLLTLDVVDLSRRAQLPVVELRKLLDVLREKLHRQLGVGIEEITAGNESGQADGGSKLHFVSTLDEGLDAALSGGIPAGYVTEITGESAAGKTQFLLTLLLSVQLQAPHGLSKSALYISTEAALSTTRLSQLSRTHPRLVQLDTGSKPSLENILSIKTPDLEAQDHILRYQLPVAIRRHNIGLVVIDSIAANFRAEFERKGQDVNSEKQMGGKAMAERRASLVAVGALLRHIARTEGIVIVVANQVADRFTPQLPPSRRNPSYNESVSQSSQRTNTDDAISNSDNIEVLSIVSPDPLTLDHQQRWFTGWGDLNHGATLRNQAHKTPSLGLIWVNQIACRIALVRQPLYRPTADDVGQELEVKKWRRFMRIVFAPWTPPTEGKGVEFEILPEGLRAVERETLDNS